MNFRVYMKYEDYMRKLSLYVFREEPNGGRSFCTDLKTMEFSQYEDNQAIETPTLSLDDRIARPFLQEIVNEAKKMGIVADKTPVLENELTATKYHLEDMRKIVFGKLANGEEND